VKVDPKVYVPMFFWKWLSKWSTKGIKTANDYFKTLDHLEEE